MDFYSENKDDVSPLYFMAIDMETIATLYELQAMVDGPKLPAGNSDAKTPQN